jgi:cob(I)alamin adenosyltransferase
MKLYTKKGDAGKTSLFDSSNHLKSEAIFDTLGTLDELSAQIGVLFVLTHDEFERWLQSKLLDLGSILATNSVVKQTTSISEDDVKRIETEIDRLEAENTPLRVFILPGVLLPDAISHVCRAVCRRAERELIRSSPQYILGIKFLNRMSDYFFAYARNLSRCKESEKI